MAKIIIDESEYVDPTTLAKIANFFERVDNPYRMPELMAQWLTDYNEQHKVDTTYSIPVGYSYNAMRLDFTFKRDMIIMTFMAPDGTRLMELRLHAL